MHLSISTSLWARVAMSELNILGFKWCVWAYFSPLMSLGNLPEPNTPLKKFPRPRASLTIFYTDLIHVILSRTTQDIKRVKLHFSPSSKKKRLVSYKYTMNLLNSRFITSLFFIFLVYIFLESIFQNYHCTFSLNTNTYLNIWESLHLSKRIFCRYQLLTTLAYQVSDTSYQPS